MHRQHSQMLGVLGRLPSALPTHSLSTTLKVESPSGVSHIQRLINVGFKDSVSLPNSGHL